VGSDLSSPRPLLLSHLRSRLSAWSGEVDIETLSVDLAEAFYDFWQGQILQLQLLDAESEDEVMRVLVNIQILLEHLVTHASDGIKALNAITLMDKKP